MSNFADLMGHTQNRASRAFHGSARGTVTAWFPASATSAPSARTEFTNAIADVHKGPPRIQRDSLSGQVLTDSSTVLFTFTAAQLSYTPLPRDTVVLLGTSRASADLYRLTLVESAGGVHQCEAVREPQNLT